MKKISVSELPKVTRNINNPDDFDDLVDELDGVRDVGCGLNLYPEEYGDPAYDLIAADRVNGSKG